MKAEKLTQEGLAAQKREWLRHHQLDLHVIVNLIFGYRGDLLPIVGERKLLFRDLKGRIDKGKLRAVLRGPTANVYASIGIEDLDEHLLTDTGHPETHKILADFLDQWTEIAGVSIESLQTEAARGAPGRPTSRHLVEGEMGRRFEAEIHEPSLGAEAAVLSKWLKRNHPKMPQMTPKTIANALRDVFKDLKAKARLAGPE